MSKIITSFSTNVRRIGHLVVGSLGIDWRWPWKCGWILSLVAFHRAPGSLRNSENRILKLTIQLKSFILLSTYNLEMGLLERENFVKYNDLVLFYVDWIKIISDNFDTWLKVMSLAIFGTGQRPAPEYFLVS